VRTKFPFAIGALLGVTALVLLFLQHQAQKKLRAENESLRRQVEQADQLTGENERLSNLVVRAQASSAGAPSSELLKLRGEVGSLRKQTNELAALRNENQRLRTASAERRENAEPPQTDPAEGELRQKVYPKLNDAKALVTGFRLYADDHQNQLPEQFEQLAPYLSRMSRITGSNAFEIVYSGPLAGITNPSALIFVREQQAWQRPDGRWAKTYGFADGHAEVHTEPDGNFESWEKERLFPRSGNP